MLAYRGHVFDGSAYCKCCVGDDRKVKIDPTGTASLRRKMATVINIRWRKVRNQLRDAIVKNDTLMLSRDPLTSGSVPAVAMGATKVQSFQRWLDFMLNTILLDDGGAYMKTPIQQGYNMGVTYAMAIVGRRERSVFAMERVSTIATLAITEMQGIIEAVSQRCVRAAANSILAHSRPAQCLRLMYTAIDKVGVARSNALVESIIVKAFGDATLDTYESAGVSQVGLVPEGKAKTKIGDARRTGPGSRASRKTTPSARTIGRIRAAELAVERLSRVNVRTAGDDDVCPICEDIADNGPYSINKARSLIPAHPRCRCTFVPAGDARFADD